MNSAKDPSRYMIFMALGPVPRSGRRRWEPEIGYIARGGLYAWNDKKAQKQCTRPTPVKSL